MFVIGPLWFVCVVWFIYWACTRKTPQQKEVQKAHEYFMAKQNAELVKQYHAEVPYTPHNDSPENYWKRHGVNALRKPLDREETREEFFARQDENAARRKKAKYL